MGEKLETTMGCGFGILMLGFAIVQAVAGWAGIEDSFGWGWGLAAVLAAVFFRFTLPIVVGAFLCAKNIWDWHWILALIFAAPGLLFMVPSIVSSVLSSVRR